MTTTSRLIAVVCIVLMACAPIEATTYLALPACESFRTADAVFVGTIRKQPEQEMRTFADRVIGRAREQRDQLGQLRLQRVTFEIRERLRGHVQKSVDVENQTGVTWAEGEAMLVYATRDQATGRLYARVASRTKPIASAAQELLQLRRFATIKEAERLIAGEALNQDHGEGVATDLTLTCGARMYKTRSNADGTFEFRIRKPSGSCDLRPVASGGLTLASSSDVAFIEPRTCADVRLRVTPEKP